MSPDSGSQTFATDKCEIIYGIMHLTQGSGTTPHPRPLPQGERGASAKPDEFLCALASLREDLCQVFNLD